MNTTFNGWSFLHMTFSFFESITHVYFTLVIVMLCCIRSLHWKSSWSGRTDEWSLSQSLVSQECQSKSPPLREFKQLKVIVSVCLAEASIKLGYILCRWFYKFPFCPLSALIVAKCAKKKTFKKARPQVLPWIFILPWMCAVSRSCVSGDFFFFSNQQKGRCEKRDFKKKSHQNKTKQSITKENVLRPVFAQVLSVVPPSNDIVCNLLLEWQRADAGK